MGAFGEKLRKQREQQGISLDAISNATKISIRMLRALEEERFEQLPGGVFNKGFVRAYARHVGLDEEEAIAEYLDALRESQVRQQAIMPDLRSGSRQIPTVSADSNREPAPHIPDRKRSSSPTPEVGLDVEPALEAFASGADRQFGHHSSADTTSRSIPWMTLALALALVVVGIALWDFIRRHEATANLHTQTGPQQSASASSTSQSAQPQGPATSRLSNQPSPLSSAGVSPKAAAATRNRIQPTPFGSSATTGPSATEAAPQPTPSSAVPANSAIATSKKGASVNSPATFTLFIRAEKTSWVSIVADGNLVTEETLIAPAHTSVRASKEITVKAGNAAGVIFELNGKQVGEPGADGEVRTYVFDANGILPAEHSPPPNP